MSTDEWQPVLKDVISDVLETMFFTMVDFEVSGSESSYAYGTEIGIFDGNGRIMVALCVTREFATMITANLLGVDESRVGEEDIEDALREFTNMVGGSYHARRKDVRWSLDIPRAWKMNGNSRGAAAENATGLDFGCFGEPAGSLSVTYAPGPDQQS